MAAHLATVVATAAAAWWFLFRASFRKKIQFDVGCSVFSHLARPDEKFVELIFSLKNKGQVENRCYTLAYEVQSVDARRDKTDPEFRASSGNIVPIEAEYYYVRAGVTLRVSARLWIPSCVSLIRVKAFILYDKERKEVDREEDLFEQMYQHRDWTALDRVFDIGNVPARIRPSKGKSPDHP